MNKRRSEIVLIMIYGWATSLAVESKMAERIVEDAAVKCVIVLECLCFLLFFFGPFLCHTWPFLILD